MQEIELFSLVWRYKMKYAVTEEELDWEAIAAELAEEGVDAERCRKHYDFMETEEHGDRADRRVREPKEKFSEEELLAILTAMTDAERGKYFAKFKAKSSPKEWEKLVCDLEKNSCGFQVPAELLAGKEVEVADVEAAREAMFGKKEVPMVYGDIDYSELE